MTTLKTLAVSFFSFILFLALAIFGVAFAMKSTVLDPDFVTSELNRLEVSSLVEEFVYIEAPPEMPDLNEIIYETASRLEPLVKEELTSVIHSVYDYVLGETRQPELVSILRNTFLSTDFVSSLLDNIDIVPLAEEYIKQQSGGAFPIEIENMDEYLAGAIADTESSLKGQLVSVSGPVFDYLLGESQTLRASISLEEVLENLKKRVRQALLESPPAELARIPENLWGAYFDQFYEQFAELVPSTFQLDENLIGNEVPSNISARLAATEETLEQVRQYVGYFLIGYQLLIVIMGLSVLGIVLTIRNVKDTTRYLGIPLLTYGAIEYGGIWIARYFSGGQPLFPDIPASLETWMFQFVDNMLKPLEMFSLSLLIGGALLVAISFLYRRNRSLS